MEKFKALRQIAEHLDGYKLRQIDIIGNDGPESRYTEFYKLLKDGKLKNDHEAAKHFYGPKATGQFPNYRKFKSLFTERLLNTFFFIDAQHSTLSDLQSTMVVVQKEVAGIRLLNRRSLQLAANVFGEQLLTIAIEYEISDAIVDLLRMIKGNIVTQTGDMKKYQYYDKLYEKHLAILLAEMEAQRLLEKIRIHLVKSIAFRPFLAEQACESYAQLQPYLEKYDTWQLHFFGRVISTMRYSTLNKWRETLVVCEEAIVFFEAKPFNCRNAIATFLHQKLICHLQLRQFEAGFAAAEQAVQSVNVGSMNWYRNLELKMFLCLRTRRFADAYALYQVVLEAKHSTYLQQTYDETWKIFEAYLYFATKIGMAAPLSIDDTNLGKFKLKKFLNEVYEFTKDKKGMNVPILIVQLLIILSEGLYDKAIDKLEALEKYRSRYIKDEEGSFRCNYFLLALQKMIDTGFNRKAFIIASSPLITTMQTVEIRIEDDGHRLEFVPFDDTWELFLTVLKD